MSIICGPLARHCSTSEINLWFVATTRYDEVEILLTSHSDGTGIANNTAAEVVELAEHCFCYMAKASFDLPDNIEIVNYDLKLDGVGIKPDAAGNSNGLQEFVCFPGQALPSLYLPKQHTRVFQSSCRKPHDDEGIDQLTEIANQIESSINSEGRPSQLYMTGDQIYADDVSPLLLEHLNNMAERLRFAEELFPVKGNLVALKSIQLDGRKLVANNNNGLSTGHGESHILTFAEYICMYLFCFAGFSDSGNNVLAPYAALKTRLRKKRKEKGKPQRYHYSRSNYKKDKAALGFFATNTSNHIRKLLANISTYMIFDDHEVTDDWNLTKYNHQKLHNTATGKHLYVNALSGYLICQHWGNQPNDEVTSELNRISELSLAPDNSTAARHALQSLWHKDWGYVIDQAPPLVVLDTRTDRVFHGPKLNKLALMSPARFDSLKQKIQQLAMTNTLIVVSATPMFGFSAIEAAQLKLGKLKSKVDREPWIADKAALDRLQEVLMQSGAEHVMVMSGDVHYAFNRRQKIDNQDVTFWQLCSSAACNTPVGGNWALPTLHTISKFFCKEETKYLWPEEDGRNFITTQKNVSSLTLDSDLAPIKTTLYCCEDSPEGQFIKTFNLIDYKEVKQD